MPDRDRMLADETFETPAQRGSFDRLASQRVWPIEHEGAQSVLRRGFEALHHRRLKRVIAAADIGQVNYQRVETGQLPGRGLQRFDGCAIETVNRNRALVDAACEH